MGKVSYEFDVLENLSVDASSNSNPCPEKIVNKFVCIFVKIYCGSWVYRLSKFGAPTKHNVSRTNTKIAILRVNAVSDPILCNERATIQGMMRTYRSF